MISIYASFLGGVNGDYESLYNIYEDYRYRYKLL